MTDLEKAQKLAAVADEITKKYYLSARLRVDTKPDKTPVTQADLEVEQALSNIVHEEFGDKYIGEEEVRDTSEGRHWIVDPIDGTKNFLRGMPIWATLIALRDGDTPLVNFVSAPALGRAWWAVKGEGAWTLDVDGTVRQLRVSNISDISDASFMFSSLGSWDQVPTGSQSVLQLLLAAWRHRAVGDFFGHVLVAEGAVEEPNLKLWDVAGVELIITEAGGSLWTNGQGKAPSEPRIVISSNQKIEAAVRQALRL